MFVRTKNNDIFEITNGRYVKNGYLYFKGIGDMLGGTDEDYKETIKKQSENLKDLCDEFVSINDYNNVRWQHETLNGAIAYAKKFPFKVTIYGSIWNGKDLIAVAQVNDKGELELL